MHLLQRIAHGAFVGVAAVAVLGKASSQKDRAIDGADHFIGRDFARVASQLVAAVGSVLGTQETVLDQLLQNFRKESRRECRKRRPSP